MTEKIQNENNIVAIYWDYENVRISDIEDQANIPSAESIIEYAKTIGTLKYQRIYSNWGSGNRAVKMSLYSLGFDLSTVPMSKTNSCDLKIAADIANDVYNDKMLGTIILITGDKDFIPIINWLKKIDKEVILIGQPEITSDHLILSANEYVPFTSFIEKEAEWTGNYKVAKKLLLTVLQEITEHMRSTRFSYVKTMMLDKAKGFHERNISDRSYKMFQDFIFEVEKDGDIQTQGSVGFLEMFLPETNVETESEFAEEISEPTIDHWNLVFDQIEQCFEDGKGKKTEGRFHYLLAYLKTMREDENLPLTRNQTLEMLDTIISEGLLIEVSTNRFKMSENYEELKRLFLSKQTLEDWN